MIINIALVNYIVKVYSLIFLLPVQVCTLTSFTFYNVTETSQLIGSMGPIYTNLCSCHKIPPIPRIGVGKTELKLRDTWVFFDVH